MGLREIESKLPPGFRFYPSDEELVCHYLCKKIRKEMVWEGTLVEVDLHTCEPWELPDVAKLSANEWYFFSFRDRKYSTGSRTNRATKTGYWKATGKDRVVHDPSSEAVVGMRKTLVFYRGRAPNGIKSGWVMHEFRLETPHMPTKEDWVLCRVFNKRNSEMTRSYGQENENLEINCSTNYYYHSPNILESSSLFDQQTMSVNYDDKDQSLSSCCFLPPALEDNKSALMAILQHNFLGEVDHMEYTNRHEEDYGFLMEMGDHDLTGGISSSSHGMGIACTEGNVDMKTCYNL